MIKFIRITLVVLWMLIIFSFSQSNGEQSGSLSTGIIKNRIMDISKTLVKIKIVKKPLSEEKAMKIAENLNYPARKCIHMMEYFILTLLIYNALALYKIKKVYLISFITSVLYAISDEIHQLFTCRTGSVKDVIIDSFGIMLAILLIYNVNKRKTNKT